MDLKEIMLLAKAENREGLAALSKDSLVEAVIMINKRFTLEKVNNPLNQQLEVVEKLQLDLINKADIGWFNSRMHEMERQLTETEEERDKFQAENEELEEKLQCLQEHVDELEQDLADMPKAGRPERYDKDFRVRVKAYYNDGHTYRETAGHFNISTNTVGRFLKE